MKIRLLAVLVAVIALSGAFAQGYQPLSGPMSDIIQTGLNQAKQTVDTSKFQKAGPYTIGFSNISVVNTWRVQMVRELKAEAARHPDVTLLTTDANGSISKQINDVQDLLAKHIDALLITPASPNALIPVVNQALQQGVPVIVFNSALAGDNYTSFIGTDEVQFGYVISKWLMDQLNCKGKIIELNGIAGNSISLDRVKGLEKAINECPDPSAVSVLAKYPSDWAYDKGKLATEQALAAYPEIDGVFSQGGAMTQGAMEAFQAAGRKLVPMTGEVNNGFLKLWNKLKPDGFSSIAASEPTWVSAVALDMAIRALQGQPVPKDYYLPIPTVTNDNLSEYVRPDLSDAFWADTRLPEDLIQQYYGQKGSN